MTTNDLPAAPRQSGPLPAQDGAAKWMSEALAAEREVQGLAAVVARLERRPSELGPALYSATRILDLLDEEEPARHAAEARWRLRHLPTRQELSKSIRVVGDALDEPPLGRAQFTLFIARMVGTRPNIRIEEKSAYVDVLVEVLVSDQPRERYVRSELAKAVDTITRTRKWLPEICEVLDELRAARVALAETRDRLLRVRDLRWNAEAVVRACDRKPSIADDPADEPIPF